MRRTAFAATGMALLSVALTGCAPTQACPEIGWINTVEIDLVGSVERVAAVQLCDETQCTTADPDLPSAGTVSWTMRKIEGNHWEAWMNMDAPDSATVTALDDAGAILAEQQNHLSWRRVGGTAECGGPDAAVVELRV